MKANPIFLLNIKREDVLGIHLTNILWMFDPWYHSQVAGDMGFAYCPVCLRERNMNDVSC